VRALLPLCPQEEVGPIRDALSQLQMMYVRATQSGAQPSEPGEPAEPAPDDERAKARSKIWIPPGA
jgi:hypothetical protein